MAMADITLYGAGIFGLSIAWACVQRGAKVQVIDPHGAGAGSSGGVVGALAPHVPENWNDKKQFQFESLIMAETFWADVEAAGGAPSGYARTGRLQPILDARGLDLARGRASSAEELWRGKARWQVVQAGQSDWEPASPTGYLIQDTLSARMHPRMACAALVAALASKGCAVHAEGTPQGTVIEATGWRGLIELADQMDQPVGNGVKGQAAVLDYAAPNSPQLFADALHIIPHANGTVAIGSTSERTFDDPSSTDDQLEDVIARARAAFPVLKGAPVIERWAGVRPRAKSRAPMTGPHPLRAGAFIANGGFKIGFGMAPKIADVMADLVLDGVDRIPEGFRPEASLRA